IDQYAGALERGDQAAYPCRAHLPQWGQLSAAGAGPRSGDPRELARAASLPQHGRSARAQEGGAAPCGLTPDPFSLAPCSLGQGTLRAGSAGAADCAAASLTVAA